MENRLSEIAVRAAVWASMQAGVDQLWLAADGASGGSPDALIAADKLYVVVVTGDAQSGAVPRIGINAKVLDDWQRALSKLTGRAAIVSVFGTLRLGADVPETAIADGICVFSRAVLSGGTLPKNITEAAKALRDVFPNAVPTDGAVAARAS